MLLQNEGSAGVLSSLDSLKEEDEGDRDSLDSPPTSQRDRRSRKRTTQSQASPEKKKEDLLNYEDDVEELHRTFAEFITVFDFERDRLATDLCYKGERRLNFGKKKALHLADFDPIYRKKDFAQIKKNITRMMVMEVTKGKHEDLLQKNLKKQEEAAKNVMDNDQRDFIKDGKKQKENIEAKRAQIENKKLRASRQSNNNKTQDYEERTSEVSDDLLSDQTGAPKKKKNNGILLRNRVSVIQSASVNTNQKTENTREKNRLYRQKHEIQSVQRTEKYFIDDLKEQMSQKYENLKSSYIHENDLTSQRVKSTAWTIQSPTRAENRVGYARGGSSVSPLASAADVRATGGNASLRNAVYNRKSITQGGQRPSRAA